MYKKSFRTIVPKKNLHSEHTLNNSYIFKNITFVGCFFYYYYFEWLRDGHVWLKHIRVVNFLTCDNVFFFLNDLIISLSCHSERKKEKKK